MEERQLRLGVVLLAVAAVLLFLFWQWTPAEEDLDPDATAAVWTVEASDITKLVIERSDGEVVLSMHDDGWHLDAPIVDLADEKEVHALLDELERLRKGIPIPDADPAEFGLADPPTVRATVTLASGAEQSVDIGDEAPVGWRTYAKGADGSVVAVAGTPGKKLLVDVDELRDARVIRYDLAAVRRVVVHSDEGTLDVHGEGKSWWLEGFSRADPDKVEDLLADLADVRFDDISDGDLAPDGIEDPAYVVTLELTTGTREVVVGDATPLGTLVRVDTGRSGWVEAPKLKFLGRGPKDVGDGRAFPVDEHDDDDLAVVLGDLEWTATRTDDGWTHDGADADTAVRAVVAVPMVYKPLPAPEPTETWGSVTSHEGDVERVVRIGQKVEAEYRTAVDGAGGKPYLIKLDDLDDLVDALTADGPAAAP